MKVEQARLSLISVVIPAFNSARFIQEAVQSVLRQTYKPIELIVVDDGSTDATREILAQTPGHFEIIHQANSGIGATRNLGVCRSSGNYLAFLDSDDIWFEQKLELQMQVFRQKPKTDVVYGHVEQFCSPELQETERNRLEHLTGHSLPAPIPSSMLIRRQVFEQVGPYDKSLRLGVEMEWYGRLCDHKANIVMLDDVVYLRRLHQANTNRLYAGESPERLLVLKQLIDRRRKPQNSKKLQES